MSFIKSPKETALILEGGKILGRILEELAKMAVPGVRTIDIDKHAEALILASGGRPAFKGYAIPGHTPFPATICSSLNTEVVHGIPLKDQILKEGDIYSIDIGMEYPSSEFGGYFTDTALTVAVGKVDAKAAQLMAVTKHALEIGIQQCYAGNSIASIGKAIQAYVKPQGYGIVRDLVGHGVGHAVHEDPPVPNYYDAKLEHWKLEPGVVIAIEPMITMGDWRVETADDGWTIQTLDHSLAAHFEHTIIITDAEPIVATKRPNEILNIEHRT